MVKNLINFFVAIEVLLPKFLGLAVNFQQLLQLELYTINTCFIRFFIEKLGSK